MNKSTLNFSGRIAMMFVLIAIGAVAAVAQPNLRVFNFNGPNSAKVNTPYQYSVRLRNIGNQPAQGVKLKIDLPLTNTSPTPHIMGKVTGLPVGCAIVARKIECNYSALTPNQQKNITFTLEYPVTTKPLAMTASATTTTPGEINANNNTIARSQTIGYFTNQLTSANVTVSLCTGTNLTSHFECELYPSSIQTFTMTLQPGGTISLPYPGYTGTWSQNTASELAFTITDGFEGASFSGFSSGASCFEGITNFIPVSTYNSPYKVCVQ